MAMSMKERISSVLLVIPLTLSFGINHFWASTVYFVGRTVGLNIVALKGLTKVVAEICGVTFLP
jgi:hypothetical protein